MSRLQWVTLTGDVRRVCLCFPNVLVNYCWIAQGMHFKEKAKLRHCGCVNFEVLSTEKNQKNEDTQLMLNIGLLLVGKREKTSHRHLTWAVSAPLCACHYNHALKTLPEAVMLSRKSTCKINQTHFPDMCGNTGDLGAARCGISPMHVIIVFTNTEKSPVTQRCLS